MTTQKQIEANHINAQRSTGPTSKEGQGIVSQNALKHGVFSKQVLLKDESKEDFEALQNEFHTHFKPEGFLERLFLERALAAAWRLSRVTQMESILISHAAKNHFDREGNIADVLHYDSGDGLMLLSRYETSLERILFRSLTELRRLQTARDTSPNVEIGFVPQNLIEDAIEDT